MAYPAFGDYVLADVPVGSPANNTVNIPAPPGLAGGDYQLVVIQSASGSVTFPAVSGWAKIVDEQSSTNPSNAGSGTGRTAVYESTTATGAFNATLTGDRVWGAARAYWTLPSGSTGRSVAVTVRVDTPGSSPTSHALPTTATAVNDSLVIGVGGSDQHSSVGATQSWPGFGTFTGRIDTGPLGNAAEMQAIGVADRQYATPTSGITTNFTSATGDEAVMVSIVLNGTSSGPVTKTGSDSATSTESGSVSLSGEDAGTGTEDGYAGEDRVGNDGGSGTDAGSASATVTSGETGTGAEQGGTTATMSGGDSNSAGPGLYPSENLYPSEILYPSSAPGTAEFGHIALSGTELGASTEQLTGLSATVTSGESGTGAEGGAVEILFGDLNLSLYVIDPATGQLLALPSVEELTLSPIRNSGGSVTLTYPPDGINFQVLRDALTGNRDLEFELWTSGSAVGALRGYLNEAAGDDIAETGRSWQFGGWFLEGRMDEAVVEPQPLGPIVPDDDEDPTNNEHANPKRELMFSAVTPGALVRTIMLQAQGRGVLADIAWDFTNATDSNGTTWPQVITTKFSPGASYRQIMDRLVALGLIEWAIVWTGTQRMLKVWRPEGRGADRTVGASPIVLRQGRNLLDAPRQWSVRDAGTAVLVAGDEGIYDEASDADAQTRRGRKIERFVSASNLVDTVSVAAFAAQQLQATTTSMYQVTHGIGFLPGEPRPILAFDVGDWIYSETHARRERLRVVQWTLTISRDRNPSGTVTLNDTVQDALVRLQARLDALTAGETVVGTSEPSQQEDTGIPLAPTGIIVGSSAHLVGTEATSATTVSWGPVEFNTDGTAVTDLAGYKVQHAFHAAPDDWIGVEDVGPNSTSATFGAPPQVWLSVRVAAYDQNGNTSAWSEIVSHETAAYESPPAVPSTPTATDFLGTGRIGWDGNTVAGTPMPAASPAFAHVQVHVSPASLFTPTAATQVGTMRSYGTFSVVDLPYGVTQFVRLVAEDAYGNVSGPSAQASFTPAKLVNIDIGPNAIDRVQIIDGEIVTAKIADLAVNDAKIANLGVGKLIAGFVTADMILSTGEIRAGNDPNAYGVYDAAGLKFVYNGVTTIEFKSSDGSALITGTYRSGLTGERINLMSDGSSRYYGSSGSDYASIENDGGVLRMRSRADGSGRRSYIDYNPVGFKAWYGAPGAERSKFDLGLTYGVVTAPVTGIRTWRHISPTDGTQNRFHFVQAGSSGDDSASVIHYYGRRAGWTSNTITDNTGVLRNAAHANGILMGGGSVAILGNRDDVYGPFTADGFSTPSSGLLKTEPTELVRHVPLGALSAVRGADGKAWYYLHDLEPWPEKPDLKVQRIREDGTAEMVDADWAREQPAPRLHFGPIAEDLQAVSPHLVHRDDQGQLMVDLRDLVGVLWAAVGELDRGVAARLDRLEGIPEAIIIDGEDVP